MSTPPIDCNQDIPVSLTILDAISRDSWCLAKISIPELGVEIEDWFHMGRQADVFDRQNTPVYTARQNSTSRISRSFEVGWGLNSCQSLSGNSLRGGF
jgi:hypothetical protein